jgi:hypothetical protein
MRRIADEMNACLETAGIEGRVFYDDSVASPGVEPGASGL